MPQGVNYAIGTHYEAQGRLVPFGQTVLKQENMFFCLKKCKESFRNNSYVWHATLLSEFSIHVYQIM